jgi:hypothetical protein
MNARHGHAVPRPNVRGFSTAQTDTPCVGKLSETQNARTLLHVRASMRSLFRGPADATNVRRATCMEGRTNANARPPGWTGHVQTRHQKHTSARAGVKPQR